MVVSKIFHNFSPKIGEMESNLTCAYLFNWVAKKNHQLLEVAERGERWDWSRQLLDGDGGHGWNPKNQRKLESEKII